MSRCQLLILAGLLVTACGETKSTPIDIVTRDAGTAIDSGTVSNDAGRDAGAVVRDAGANPIDGGTRDGGTGSPVDGGPENDAGTMGMTGSIFGNVTRSAEPANGGVGNLFIGIFTADPVRDPNNAVPVANVLVENVDMTAANASIPYTLEGIPPRADPYFITAFLDDNDNATLPDAAPDRGDLVAIDRLRAPEVTVPTTTAVPFDIDLNFNLPF